MKNNWLFPFLLCAAVSQIQAATLECDYSTSQPETQQNGYQDIVYNKMEVATKIIQPSQPGWRPTAQISVDSKDGKYHLDAYAAQMQDNSYQIDADVTDLTTKVIAQSVVTNIAGQNRSSARLLTPLQNPDPEKYPGGKISYGALQPASAGVTADCRVR
jgi:hypothetical protein